LVVLHWDKTTPRDETDADAKAPLPHWEVAAVRRQAGLESGGPIASAEWQAVCIVETVPSGSVLDLRLRREQAQVLLELAALVSQRPERGREGEW
jgi:hypothetical protein